MLFDKILLHKYLLIQNKAGGFYRYNLTDYFRFIRDLYFAV